MSISQVGVAGSATPRQQLHAIAAPISKSAPLMISKVPHGQIAMLRLTSTHPDELSPAKLLIRNVDIDFPGCNRTIVAIVQRWVKKTLVLPKNLAVPLPVGKKCTWQLRKKKIVLIRTGAYRPVDIENHQCRKVD
jgi:hypothetical protein